MRICDTCKYFVYITEECKLALIKNTPNPKSDPKFCLDHFCEGEFNRIKVKEYYKIVANDKDIIKKLKLVLNSVYGLSVMPSIKKVIFNEPATIVFWSDDTKTVVKCDKDDIFDPEKGLAIAIAKKALGTNENRSNYYDIFKKYLKEYEQNKEIEQLDKKARNIKVRITID